MGGCRCTFRNCTVSSARLPGMHFFRFPAKEKERLTKWANMAATPHILDIPLKVLRNRVVCARHFRDEQFMNYKKDRLISKAVPTLMRLGESLALDYAQLDEHGEPKLVVLEKPTKQYLIPPPDFLCPLGLGDLNVTALPQLDLTHTNISETANSELLHQHNITTVNEQSVGVHAVKRSVDTETETTTKRLKIIEANEESLTVTLSDENSSEFQYESIIYNQEDLMLQHPQLSKAIEVYNIQQEDSNITVSAKSTPSREVAPKEYAEKEVQVNISQSNDSNCGITKQQYEEVLGKLESELQKTRESSAYVRQQKSVLKNVCHQLQTTRLLVKSSKEECDRLSAENEQLMKRNAELEAIEAELRSQNKLLKKDFDDSQIKCQMLTTTNVKLERRCAKLEEEQQQVATVTTSKEIPPKMSASVAPSSKAQLFNGVKKYLSASMVALLRMEMFGSSEREWKADEQRTAVELLRLGERVYRYFTEEWRLRLPALRQVSQWLLESVELDEDEDL